MRHRRSSLASKLLAFFEANPTEELTPQQIRDKFDVRSTNVIMTLRRLNRTEGPLENVRVVRLRSLGR